MRDYFYYLIDPVFSCNISCFQLLTVTIYKILMSVLNQKTIKKEISFKGISLHKGKIVNLKILPGAPNTGIIFKRTDIKNNNILIPNVFNVSNANFCTTISNEHGVSISTIEHLMAALFIKGVDNSLVEVDAEELPILDGSAKEFVKKIETVGLETSQNPIKVIKIEKKVELVDDQKFISIEPSKISLDINFDIKYKNIIIGNQKNHVNVYEDDLKNIINSRTFCLFEDIDKLKKMNLALGGSLDNAIVVKDNKILNENGLRNDKEFVNHKILDCIGDLYLSGFKMIAKIKCSQGGHSLTNQLLRKVFADKNNYTLLEIKGQSLPAAFINKNPLKSIA